MLAHNLRLLQTEGGGMPRTNKSKTHLSQVPAHCSEKTEVINRCIFGVIAKLFKQYPQAFDISGIIEATPHRELSIEVIGMLVHDGIMAGAIHQMNLTLAGYSAVKVATRAEPRLAVALREENSPKLPHDYTALILSILRVYSTRRRRT